MQSLKGKVDKGKVVIYGDTKKYNEKIRLDGAYW